MEWRAAACVRSFPSLLTNGVLDFDHEEDLFTILLLDVNITGLLGFSATMNGTYRNPNESAMYNSHRGPILESQTAAAANNIHSCLKSS